MGFTKILDIHAIRRLSMSFLSYDLDEMQGDLDDFLEAFQNILVIDDKSLCLSAFMTRSFRKYLRTLLVTPDNFNSWSDEAARILELSPDDGDPLIIVHARVAKSNCPSCGCLGVNDVRFLDKIESISRSLKSSRGQTLHMLAFDSTEEQCPLIMRDLAHRLAA